MNRPDNHVLTWAEGAAFRIQLDAMIKVLDPVDDLAAQRGDNALLTLIARLHEARAAALTIETRDQAAPTYKGVDLVKH